MNNVKYVCLIVLFLVGCFNYHMDSSGGIRPTFSLKSYRLPSDFPDSLRLDGVYLRTEIEKNHKTWEYDTTYCFLRFFPEGQVFSGVGVTEKYPTIKEFNSLRRGFVGYYFNNRDTISITMFQLATVFKGEFYREIGFLKSDTLVLTSWAQPDDGIFLREGELIPPEKYIRINVDYLAGEPDW